MMVASVAPVKDAKSAVSYMEQEGYYADNDPEMRAASRWQGSGAARLGLEGEVDSDRLYRILEGHVPGEERQLGRKVNGAHIHQPGIDMTFSAPKSVSLAALVGGDKQILEAHRKAVAGALDYVEREMVHTRVQIAPGARDTKMIRGQEIIAATFEHDTSRNLDPQLHTHCVIANMVHGDDGKWRTMHNRNLFQDIKLAGAVYRAELAQALKELGYNIETVAKDGRFELAGFDEKTIRAFSTRRAEIEQAMQDKTKLFTREKDGGKGMSDAALAQRAALYTRQAKRDVDRDAVKADWAKANDALDRSIGAQMAASKGARAVEQENALGFTDRVIESVRAFLGGEDMRERESPDMSGDKAVQWAVRHLSERTATFKMSDLTRLALERGGGHLGVSVIEGAIERQVARGDVQRFGNGRGATTREMVGREQAILDHFDMGVGTGRQISQSSVMSALSDTRLTDGQRHAVQSILESSDKGVLVQGHAGSGKTTMLATAKELTEGQGHKIIGIAASASAANVLTREAGIESETLQRFIGRHEWVTQDSAKLGDMARAYEKTVLVVDEASFVSSVQMSRLNAITDKLDFARVVLVGDRHQLDSVEAGTPFAELQKAGNDASVMDSILRQRNPILKAAVIDVIERNPAAALNRLGENVIETGALSRLAQTAAQKYLSLDVATRADTGIMAPTNALRSEINTLIRNEMARDGLITGAAAEVTRLASKGLTEAEREVAASYEPGNIVRFTREVQGIEARQGDYMEVVSTDHERGAVILRDARGIERAIDPERGIAPRLDVFEPAEMELRQGDQMRWTANDKDNELFNSRTFDVTGVDDTRGAVSIRTDDGREMTLPQSAPQLQHSDYAFNRTVHAFQGSTVENAIAVMESGHPELTNQKTFYVELSRAREEAWIITDDKERLAANLQANTGEQLTALEAIDPARLAGLGEIETREADILDDTRAEIGSAGDGNITYEEWEAMNAEADRSLDDIDADYSGWDKDAEHPPELALE